MKRSSRGFTLIEILVVVAIIGILTSVAVVGYAQARMKARDSQRMSDLRQVQRALELYYLANNQYPSETWCDSSRGSSGTAGCETVSGTAWDTSSAIWTALVPTYIQALPVDPLNNASYYYVYEPDNLSTPNYCMGVNLERGGRFQVKNGTTMSC